jgi:capsular polysaccharide biosynthesis protein
MKKKISVSLPANIRDEEMCLFLPFSTYELNSLKLKKIKNAFVTYNGYCLDKNGLIKESHHHYPHQYGRFLKEASEFYHEAADNPHNLIELDNDHTYLLIHHPWFMYYHWICESLFRLWMVKDEIKNMILILPDYYQKTEFVMATLEPFLFNGFFFIPASKSVMVKNLSMPQIKPLMESYDATTMKEIRGFYQDYVRSKKDSYRFSGDRIYISRKKADRRKIINEHEVIDVLNKYNFTILNNEDYSFFEQVAIYSNAKCLVSIHGSGLTNMLFMADNSTVFELHKRKTNRGDWHSLIFWYMADALGHKYYHQICEPTDINHDIIHADLVVDIDLFERNLSKML